MDQEEDRKKEKKKVKWPPLQFTDARAVRDAAILLFSPHEEQRKRPVGAKEKGPTRLCQGARLVHSCVARYRFVRLGLKKQDVVVMLGGGTTSAFVSTQLFFVALERKHSDVLLI